MPPRGPLIDAVIALTGQHDRDSFEASLVLTLWDCTSPSRIALQRLCGDPEAPSMCCALAREGELVTGSLVTRSRQRTTRVADVPAMAAAWSRREVVRVPRPRGSHEIHPVRVGQRVFALLEIESARRLTRTQSRQIEALLTLASNYLALINESERDVLTELHNRRTFDRYFSRMQSDGATKQWLGVIDIDHFKQVNDRFGHLYGDEVLILVARLMQASFRYTDMLYRFGGEEFVVLLECDDGTSAGCAFDRFSRSVANKDFPQVGRVTVSIGYTEISPGEVAAAAIARADEALYWAKGNGRNRVAWHEALVREGALHQQREDATAGEVEMF